MIRDQDKVEIRVTREAEYSHVIPPAHLDAQVERLKLDQAGNV